MKSLKKFTYFFAFSVFLILSATVNAQTAGSLTFSCTTAAPSGNWGDKHVLAVWIENTQNPSVFIKTKSKYGSEDDHLTAWGSKSGKNLVDAVTGATLSAYGKQSIIWDGTNVSHNVVADGNYNVFIENDVIVGDNVTIKSGVQIWDGLRIGDNVFISPNVTFTNDLLPRSKHFPEIF